MEGSNIPHVHACINYSIGKINWFHPSTFHVLLMNFFFAAFVIVEPIRLWLGYTGNLKERVPDLAGFFLFTCFPQIFSCFYYISIQPKLGSGFSIPFEIALNTVYLFLLIPEIFLGYMAARAIIRSQAASFFLHLQ
ncbi:hypothetical protein BC829DRAFT_362941 [Chytridium lagenaria]|nr:hypothetical protein BC829DRAFT_362941 [Chytridium lagenaria]